MDRRESTLANVKGGCKWFNEELPSSHLIAMRMTNTATIIEMPSFMSEWSVDGP